MAYLPAQSTFEIQLTSGKFEGDLFVMANNADFEENTTTYVVYNTEYVTPVNNVATLAYKAYKGASETTHHVYINGLEETTSASVTTKHFVVTDNTDDSTITFFAGDIPDDTKVKITYEHQVTAKEAKIDNRNSTIGEAILAWPVYAGYDSDGCDIESSITGHFVMRVYRARVTQAPGMDSSYKTAGTYQFTLSAMDAKRADNCDYSTAFIAGNVM